MDGWINREWQEQQDQIWKQMQSRKSSQRWTSELIKKLWNVAWDMWDQRNEALHDSGLNRELILKKDINDQIKQIYAVVMGQLACMDVGLMWNSVEHQLQLPLQTKQQWVASVDVALHRKHLHEHGTMLAEQQLMENWVIRNPPCQTPAPVSQRWVSHSQERPWAGAMAPGGGREEGKNTTCTYIIITITWRPKQQKGDQQIHRVACIIPHTGATQSEVWWR